MKILRIIAIFLLIGGTVLAGLGAYFYFYNEDEARAMNYSAEQERLLAEAFRGKGTPRERELMKEYEEGKSVTELAWEHARRTRQTALLLAGGGLAMIIVSIVMAVISRTRVRAPTV